MSISTKDIFLAAVAQDLKLFLIQAFNELNPNTEFLDNWHIDAIVNCLELSIEGKMPRLIINLPPRNLKSILISVALPAFLMGRDPTVKIICVSYGEDLANDLARKTRRILTSPWYRKIFPKVKLVKTSESELETDMGGCGTPPRWGVRSLERAPISSSLMTRQSLLRWDRSPAQQRPTSGTATLCYHAWTTRNTAC